MVLKPLTAQGLEALCSQDQLRLLNAVDSLRSQGVSHYISLPQIIVCGDQSSGKSSVLESISGVSFPVKSNLSTRFPIELVLRKTPLTSVNISIAPHHSRDDSDRESLSRFHEKLEDFKDLPELIEKAKVAMGVMTQGRAFANDILRIEVNGPDRPHLTIVDLPGLIHSENKHQSASDVQLITDVVTSYMKEPRSIILAVISAKNDYANQIVLKLARKADPTGARTLGVITKPDTLIPGSESERMFLSLARNQDVEFRLGWHVLRNRDTEAEEWTFDQRDAQERSFLSMGAWASLSASNLGITTLRDRLSKVLVKQIASELPNLIEEIANRSTQCQKQLDKLGQPRITVHEQKKYLMEMSQSFQGLIQAATHGTYNDPYFGDAMSLVGYQKRVRAVVQNLNGEFADKMALDGRRYTIVESKMKDSKERRDLLTRDEYVEKIVPIIQRSRGRELPGMFNSMIVTELFKELSSPWTEIATQHLQKTWTTIRVSLRHLITHTADSTTANAIFTIVFESKLASLLQESQLKLAELLKPHQAGHPITYNHYFTETLQNIRMERQKSKIARLVSEIFGGTALEGTESFYVNGSGFTSLVQKLAEQPERDMDHFAASEALDCLNAYYKVARKRFVDDVAVQVVEGFLDALKDLLDPISIFNMTEAEVVRIASETQESRTAREELEAKLKILKSGTSTCKEFAAIYFNDVKDEASDADPDSDVRRDNSSAVAEATQDEIPTPCEAKDEGTPILLPEEPVVGEELPHPANDDFDGWRSILAPSKKDKKKKKKAALAEPEHVYGDDF